MASRFWVGGTGTWDNSTTTNWAATSNGAGGQSVPGSGDTVTFDASSGGGTVTLNYNPTVISITCGAHTGTLDFNTRNLTLSTFNGAGTGVRTLTMGSGIWTITGNAATIIQLNTITNLTFTATTCTINCTYAGSTGTRTVLSNVQLGDLNFTAGTDILAIATTSCTSLSFAGFTGTCTPSGIITVFGDFTLGTGMTFTSNANQLKLRATSGTKIFTSNSVQMNCPLTIDGVGGTFQLADNLDMGGATPRVLTITNGAFTANNKNVTCGSVSSSVSNVRGLTMGNGLWTITDVGSSNIPWNTGTITNLTFAANSSTIKLTDSSNTNITFTGGGLTYNNLWFSRGASTGTNTISGSNTFTDFKDDGSVAHTDLFTASTTTTVTTFTVSGSSGNIITLNSTVNGTAWTLSKASGIVSRDYLTIRDSRAQGGANFYAGANSTSTSGNTGWQFFTANTAQNSSFFFLF